MRTCVGCRQGKGKGEMVRLVAADPGVRVDLQGRAPGRGAYLCRDPACWTTAERRQALNRALRVSVTAEDWLRLRAGILS
ncbi:MAG: YlxR family protein [Candidatus Dormibacter sp.]